LAVLKTIGEKSTPNRFYPAYPISQDAAGRRWKKLVKDDLGITMNLMP
jgi:hypothetical protein